MPVFTFLRLSFRFVTRASFLNVTGHPRCENTHVTKMTLEIFVKSYAGRGRRRKDGLCGLRLLKRVVNAEMTAEWCRKESCADVN